MAGYSKLFSEIVTSSIWSEDDKTRIVWITMLALKDSRGFVPAALPGLANAARVSVARCEAAVAILESPDKHSRTPDNDGRRIKKVDGGWMVLNHDKYRDKRADEERKEYQRKWQAEHRRRQNVDNVDTNVDSVDTMLTHSDADADADTDIRVGASAPAAPAGISELVAKIKECRPEFKTLNDIAVQNTLKDVPLKDAQAAVQDWCRDWANAIKAPAMPLKSLAAYLAKAVGGGSNLSRPGNDRKLFPGEILKLLAEARSQKEKFWSCNARMGSHGSEIMPTEHLAEWNKLKTRVREWEAQV